MRLLTGFLWFLYKIFILYTLVVYALTYWTPSSHWLLGFMMISLPVLIVVHLVFMVFWLFLSPRRAFVILLVLLAGWPFLKRTYRPSFSTDKSLASKPTSSEKKSLTVLNYNVFSFGWYKYRNEKDQATVEKFKTWMGQQDADILCLQEYVSDPNSKNFNITELLIKKGYTHQAFLLQKAGSSGRFGLALFSKYPILATRDTLFTSQNGLLQADIIWKKDTVRIINVHLYSMTLQLSEMVHAPDYEKKKHEARYAFRQLRRGFEARAQEIVPLQRWVRNSPYPIIVCGDFNDTPYGYVYGRMSRWLANAFEEQGQGFGFTYNRLPSFIRIDNQFYDSKRLNLMEFRTMQDVPHSDHYPLMGRYSLK